MRSGRILILAVLVAAVPGPPAAANPVTAGPLRAAPLGEIVEAPDGKSDMELVRFEGSVTARLQALAPEETLLVDDWPIAPGRRAQVVLRRFDVYAPDAKIVVIEDGVEREAPRSSLAFFQGSVQDGLDAGSRFVTWIDPGTGLAGGLATTTQGTILLSASDTPGDDRLRLASASALRGASASPVWACAVPDDEFGGGIGTTHHEGMTDRLAPGTGHAEVTALGTLTRTAVIAFDTDAEYLNLRFANSTSAATTYISQLVAGMTLIYERDAGSGNGNGVRILQGLTILRVGEASDPYSDTTGGVVSNDPRLTEFRDYWNTNYPTAVVKRALAAMLSGRQGGACSLSGCSASGIASLSGLCASNGYSLNLLFNVAFGVNLDLSILAHEVGHNFGANHTHNCAAFNPTIDDCVSTAEASDSCAAVAVCPSQQVYNGVTATGTLMSYCQFRRPSCDSFLVFHPRSITGDAPSFANGILDNISAAGCLSSLSGGVVPAAPTISSLSVTSGALVGGTSTVITGTNFVNGATVAFVELPSGDVFGTPSSKAAASVTFNSATQLTVTTPSATNAGAVDVVVMNPDFQTATRASGFTYSTTPPAPTVTAVSPNTGSTAGGGTVTITGTGFVATPTVTFGGTSAARTFVSSTTLTATVPAHAAGIVNVVVTNPDAQAGTLTNGFAYLPPASASRYYVLTPCRLFDTRNDTGVAAAAPILAAGETRTLDVSGRCGVPDTALSLTVNATVTGSAAAGELRLFPGNSISPDPPASALFYAAGRTRANNGIIRLATDGTATLMVRNVSAGSVHFILDVSGYYLLAP